MTYLVPEKLDFSEFMSMEVKGIGQMKVSVYLNKGSPIPLQQVVLNLNQYSSFGKVPFGMRYLSIQGRYLKIDKV